MSGLGAPLRTATPTGNGRNRLLGIGNDVARRDHFRKRRLNDHHVEWIALDNPLLRSESGSNRRIHFLTGLGFETRRELIQDGPHITGSNDRNFVLCPDVI